jgi:trypsin
VGPDRTNPSCTDPDQATASPITRLCTAAKAELWPSEPLASVTTMRTLTALLLALTLATPQAQAEPKIVGGEVVEDPAAYPFMVALTTPEGRQFCGGALTEPRTVVTAAHCVANLKPRDVRIVAGRTDLADERGTVSKVTDIEVHPDFRAATTGADIAIITTAKSLPYQPIALPRPDLYEAGTKGTVLGWGHTSEGGEPSRQLREADIPIMADEDCAYPEYDPASMFCAGLPEGGVDACQGDSGGPFVVDGRLAGIVSWGNGCARPDQPGVYTRVAAYLTQT